MSGPVTPSAFWARVDTSSGPSGCWWWTGPRNPKGYGVVAIKRSGRASTDGAHRIAYRLSFGNIPLGLQLDHLCRQATCVNPAHLEAVTPRENTLRGRSFAAVNAAKSTCIWGHPLSPDTRPSKPGRRWCLTCRREQRRKGSKP